MEDGIRRALACRFVLCLSVLLVTARLDVQAERLPITVFTTADGLAHNTVNRIVKDSRGFLWFCTADGLSRFDGYVFSNFGTEQGLPHSSVNDLLETRAGEYWVATGGGLVRFDPKGKPDRRVVYEGATATPSAMFTVIVPDDEDRLARAITVLLEGTRSYLKKREHRETTSAVVRLRPRADVHSGDESESVTGRPEPAGVPDSARTRVRR